MISHLSGSLQKSKIYWCKIAIGLEQASICNSLSSLCIKAQCTVGLPSLWAWQIWQNLEGNAKTWKHEIMSR